MDDGSFRDAARKRLAGLEKDLEQLRKGAGDEHQALIRELENILREIRSALGLIR